MRNLRQRISDESGVATVMVALSIPWILMFCVFAVDVANWFVHKRHVQIQADAAALAGAGAFTFPSCDDDLITNAALRYSGKGDGTVAYNESSLVNTDDSRLFAEINKPNYHEQTTPNDADLASEPTPCEAKFVDVKMTEKDLPWFWGAADTDFINAQARVQLFQVTQMDSLLPLGVQEAAPRKVRAYIIDEDNPTATPLADVVLTQHGADGDLQLFDNENDSSGDPDPDGLPITVPSTVSNLGVRLALGGGTSTTCGDTLVQCYDSASTDGLSYIRAWDVGTDPGTNGAPVVRRVSLTGNTCDNGSFVPNEAACTVDVEAVVKWQPSIGASDILSGSPADGTAGKARLTLQFDGDPYPMTYDSTDQVWNTTITVPSGTIGPKDLDIDWVQRKPGTSVVIGTKTEGCTDNNGTKCKGTFSDVQRVFWNDAGNQSSRGGPVGRLEVQDRFTLNPVSDLRRCSSTYTTCTYNLLITVGVEGALALSDPADDPVSLRVQGGSQNQTLDCDPGPPGGMGPDFVDELAYGCEPRYEINTGQTCSTTEAEPYSCVPVQTGTAANKPAKGFNIRFLCAPTGNPGGCGGTPGAYDGKPATCPAAGSYGHNNWPDYPAGDPRIVNVFLVPFGTFQASGNELVPIIDFAAFYVTGWSSTGQGFDNPCADDGDEFVPGSEDDSGVISGHFIKYVAPNTGGSGTDTCDFDDVGACVAILVK